MTSREQRQLAFVVRDALAAAKTPEQRTQIVTAVAAQIAQFPCTKKQVATVAMIQEVLQREEGIITADVTASRALTTQQKKSVHDAVIKKFDAKDVVIREKIDASLIGGIKVRVGDEVFDASIRSSLNRFAHQLHA